MKKIYIIAGEASGDMHAANLIREMRKLQPDVRFRGFGGDRMIAENAEIIQHYRDIAFMGFKEVAMNIRTITKAMNQCKKDILEFKPDALILIDYPGFNMRMAKFAKKHGIRVIYYILPQIWAWKESRAKIIRDNTDLLLSIIPFEKEFYKKWNAAVTYTGHPLLEVINSFIPDSAFKEKHSLDNRPIVAILPGSRKQEIEKILPVMLTVIPHFPDYQFVIGATSSVPSEIYEKFTTGHQVNVITDNTYDLLSIASAGIVKSGTSTIETALFNVPFFVCYKTTGLTYFLGKQFVKNIDYISLVNLIPGKSVVKEFIQNGFNEATVKTELLKIFTDLDYKQEMLNNFNELRTMLGISGASHRAGKAILDFIDNQLLIKTQ